MLQQIKTIRSDGGKYQVEVTLSTHEAEQTPRVKRLATAVIGVAKARYQAAPAETGTTGKGRSVTQVYLFDDLARAHAFENDTKRYLFVSDQIRCFLEQPQSKRTSACSLAKISDILQSKRFKGLDHVERARQEYGENIAQVLEKEIFVLAKQHSLSKEQLQQLKDAFNGVYGNTQREEVLELLIHSLNAQFPIEADLTLVETGSFANVVDVTPKESLAQSVTKSWWGLLDQLSAAPKKGLSSRDHHVLGTPLQQHLQAVDPEMAQVVMGKKGLSAIRQFLEHCRADQQLWDRLIQIVTPEHLAQIRKAIDADKGYVLGVGVRAPNTLLGLVAQLEEAKSTPAPLPEPVSLADIDTFAPLSEYAQKVLDTLPPGRHAQITRALSGSQGIAVYHAARAYVAGSPSQRAARNAWRQLIDFMKNAKGNTAIEYPHTAEGQEGYRALADALGAVDPTLPKRVFSRNMGSQLFGNKERHEGSRFYPLSALRQLLDYCQEDSDLWQSLKQEAAPDDWKVIEARLNEDRKGVLNPHHTLRAHLEKLKKA